MLDVATCPNSTLNLAERRIGGVRASGARCAGRRIPRWPNQHSTSFTRSIRPSPPRSPRQPPPSFTSRAATAAAAPASSGPTTSSITSSFHTPDRPRSASRSADGKLDERDAEVIGRDPGTDVAVLRVERRRPDPGHVPRARRPRGRQPRARDRPPRPHRARVAARDRRARPRASRRRAAARSIATSRPIARSRAASRAAR